MNEQQTYTIKINQFEGPFDLLLFFIERDELDINDIPVAQITNDFLAYINEMERLNIEVASEFILVAASLMRIKAKMLLPRKQLDEDGVEIDPRAELVNRLIQYRKFKEVLPDLDQLEYDRIQMHERGNTKAEFQQLAQDALVDIELESLNMFGLLKAFQRVLNRLEDKKKSVHRIVQFDYNIAGQRSMIEKRLAVDARLDFDEVFEGIEERVHAIVTFLAILEMANSQEIILIGGQEANSFWLAKRSDEEEE